MKRATKTVAAIGGVAMVALLGGCAVNDSPSYAEVRVQTEQAIRQIVDLLPDGAQYAPGDEQQPYSCGGDILPLQEGPKGTAFYTGRGEATMPEGSDADSFVTGLPAALGEDWREKDPAGSVPFTTVSLTHIATGVNVSVDAIAGPDQMIVGITATSPCGSVE